MAVAKITILGATGSIGLNTLDVVGRYPDKYEVFALTAKGSVELMFEQCRKFQPRYAVMTEADAAQALREALKAAGLGTEVLAGPQSLNQVAAADDVDMVMAAIVGAAGLLPALAAARSGKKVLLANKEALVMAGELFMEAVEKADAVLIPIDSEHNAVFQCLPINQKARFERQAAMGFEKIILTASGGPFLHTPLEQMEGMTPDQACAHPNWEMGRKISVDSATMMNKALELIEASYLFRTPPEDIDVVIHPQSIVHSMVQYRDGSVLAQMGNPDMRTPIAYGLAWPERIASGVKTLDLAAAGQLNFFAPDEKRFPSLRIGRQAAESKGAAPIILNAANEVAVAAFLEKSLGFTGIPVIIDAVLQSQQAESPSSVDDVLEIDRQARAMAYSILKTWDKAALN